MLKKISHTTLRLMFQSQSKKTGKKRRKKFIPLSIIFLLIIFISNIRTHTLPTSLVEVMKDELGDLSGIRGARKTITQEPTYTPHFTK